MFRFYWLIFALPVWTRSVCYADLQVAVAANFQEPAEKIAKAFTKLSGEKVTITSGASGKFYAQIENGAPFDVFLSADQSFPEKLVAKQLADAKSEFTYAEGTLVLFSATDNLIDQSANILKKKSFKHLAMANPKLAPYGRAAEETLRKMGLIPEMKSKWVIGESVAQTFQFITTGNAELGFVPLSMLKNYQGGSRWIVPKENYAPILQDAVIITGSKNKSIAREFMNFIKSNVARALILDYGYSVPKRVP
jgi:molybdate transport system substrate-binding protein